MTNNKLQIRSKIPIPKSTICVILIMFLLALPMAHSRALLEGDNQLTLQTDTDQDGLSDNDELHIYRTNPNSPDTDGDGYADNEEIQNAYDPNKVWDDKLEKIIGISLKDQTLTYSIGHYVLNTIKISSGLPRTSTPKGAFSVLAKKPIVHYRGSGYNYPNTKWNLLFKTGSWGNYYIHGAYWHNNFGRPMSHGCVNIAYADMETLYDWAKEGTKVIIE